MMRVSGMGTAYAAVTLAAACTAAALGLAGCGGHGQKQAARRDAPVQTALAERRDVPVYIEDFGNLTAFASVDVKSQVTGKIKTIHFKNGQDVKQGDPLFTIDETEYRALADKAKATLQTADADARLKKSTLERNKPLLASRTISQQDYDQSDTEYQDAVAQTGLARAALQLAEVTLNYCAIRSPIDGRAANNLLDAGNIVAANTGPVLVTVKCMSPLRVNFNLPERNLERVRKAMDEGSLVVRVIGHTAQGRITTTGTLVFLTNTVDPQTGTFLLQATIPNTDLAFWPGQFVDVRLFLGTLKGAVVVPVQTVAVGKDGPYVFVINDKKQAELRLVTLGERSDELQVIDEGVKAGERVVTVGQLGLAPKMTIEDVTAEAKAKAAADEPTTGPATEAKR